MDEVSFRPGCAEVVRRGKLLDQSYRPPPRFRGQHIRAQHIFQIKRKSHVAFEQKNVPRQPSRIAQTMQGRARLFPRGNGSEVRGEETPGCAGEDDVSMGDPRQERRIRQRSPLPAQPG